jgi:hypothetical protein
MMRRAMLFAGLVAVAALAAGVLGTGKALAYGHTDQPVAQVEISGNCDNPSFFFCSNVVGVGGIWAWAELTTVPSTTVSGWNEMDATVADCGHTPGGGAEIATSGAAEPLLALGGGNPYTGPVYVLDFFPGSGPSDFMPVVPVAQGHYSAQPAPAVTIQIQVAP